LLHRALSNLVLNSLDAMPAGGTLTIRTAQKNGAVRVEVSDTGTGLTPEECERLFTPYYTTKRHGTGLGLAIVQSIVSDHHGKISVESVHGSGATFRIELPVRQANSENHASANGAPRPAESDQATSQQPPTRKPGPGSILGLTGEGPGA
jgi:signal transduction histidine kinase